MAALGHLFALTAPLFLLVFVGYGLIRWGRWEQSIGDALTRFVFAVAVPALLFRMMIGLPRQPGVDARLLVAFFGGCLVVFFVGRELGGRLFGLDGAAPSVFAVGGIFSNNVLLGLPVAKTLLGDAALPTVSLIVVFNAFLLWTLVTVSVEWSRQGSASVAGVARTAGGVLANPIVAAIVAGIAWGYAVGPLPDFADRTLELISQAAVPLSLIALGMGLAEFGIRDGLGTSAAMSVLKLIVHPAVVLLFAWLLALPPLETQAIVLMAACPVGANVYLMSRQFDTLGGPVAGSLVLSTAVAALTAPIVLALTVHATNLAR